MAPSSPCWPFQKNWSDTVPLVRSVTAFPQILKTCPHGDSAGARVPTLRIVESSACAVRTPKTTASITRRVSALFSIALSYSNRAIAATARSGRRRSRAGALGARGMGPHVEPAVDHPLLAEVSLGAALGQHVGETL